jgi:hypothetical protein
VESVSNFAYIPPKQWTYDRIKENGWCESDVYRLRSPAGASSCYYASLLKPNAAVDHSECSPLRI